MMLGMTQFDIAARIITDQLLVIRLLPLSVSYVPAPVLFALRHPQSPTVLNLLFFPNMPPSLLTIATAMTKNFMHVIKLKAGMEAVGCYCCLQFIMHAPYTRYVPLPSN